MLITKKIGKEIRVRVPNLRNSKTVILSQSNLGNSVPETHIIL
jgi:hypothetical protein